MSEKTAILRSTRKYNAFSEDAGGGGAGVPGGTTPPRPYPELNVTFAEALQAGGGHSQSGGRGVSAGARSRPGDRRGSVGAGGALCPLLGAHSRSTLDPSAVPAPGSHAEGGTEGAPSSPPKLEAAERTASGHQVRPPACRARARPLGEPALAWQRGPRSPQGHAGADSGRRGPYRRRGRGPEWGAGGLEGWSGRLRLLLPSSGGQRRLA